MGEPIKDRKFVTCIVCLNICGTNWGVCPNCQEPLPEDDDE